MKTIYALKTQGITTKEDNEQNSHLYLMINQSHSGKVLTKTHSSSNKVQSDTNLTTLKSVIENESNENQNEKGWVI